MEMTQKIWAWYLAISLQTSKRFLVAIVSLIFKTLKESFSKFYLDYITYNNAKFYIEI